MPSRVFWGAFVGAAIASSFVACGRTTTATDANGLVRAADEAAATPFGVSIRELNDFDVVGPGGEKYGEVEYVLVDASGALTAVVVELDGDRFGAERLVQMDVDTLSLRQGEGSRALVSPMPIEEVGRLETYAGGRN